MIYSNDNLRHCLALTSTAYASWREKQGEGFRLHSLSLAGTASAPLYTAVVVKSEPPFQGQSWPRLTKNELSAKIVEMAKKDPPLHPYIVAATGARPNAVYAAAFRRAAIATTAAADLSADELEEVNKAQRGSARILLWLDSFGPPADIRYCAVWGDNPDRVAWNAEASTDTETAVQQKFNAMVSIGARPALVAPTSAGGIAGLYVDTHLKHKWSMNPPITAAAMKSLAISEAEKGRFPVRIGSATVDGTVLFAAIFAKSDEIVQREFRMRGPDPIGLNAVELAKTAAIDAWMADYVRKNNFRGAAVAVLQGTRLVYTKGYTLAEPEPIYADVWPTTLFRMASASKTFCAVAVWKALADDPGVSRDSTMQSVLKLKTKGMAPKFADVTIRQLLESNSGIDQSGVRATVSNAKTNGASQPLTASQITDAVALRPMSGTPGAFRADGKRASKYGRTDYFLLGRIAAKLGGVDGFDTALQKLVLGPLGMKLTRGARSKAEDRSSDEAHHHVPGLETGASAVHSDRRLVPEQYGNENYEIYDGAGGVSAAVVDLARLGAMFACRTNNPVLSAATLDAMMADAVAATAEGGDHGYHGFDNAFPAGPGAAGVMYAKGGTNPGVGAGIAGVAGGTVVIITRNGDNGAGLPNNWQAGIGGIAAGVNWGSGDLFPEPFKMPALMA